MSLRRRTALILTALLAVYMTLSYVIQARVVGPSYEKLERDAGAQDMRRGVQALESEVAHVAVIANDWATWDETYQFVVDRNQGYIQRNLMPQAFGAASINLLIVTDLKGRVTWAGAYDLEREVIVPLTEIRGKQLPVTWRRFCSFTGTRDAVKGVSMTSGGLMALGAKPIVTSVGRGPIRGAVIMGRFLDATAVKKIAEQAQINLKIEPLQAASAETRGLVANLTPATGPAFTISGALLQVHSTYPGADGKPLLALQVERQRDVTRTGRETLRLATISMLAVGLLTLAAVLLAVSRLVISPLRRLDEMTQRVATGDLSATVELHTRDELGRLATSFNRMTAALSSSRAELLASLREKEVLLKEVHHRVKNNMQVISSLLNLQSGFVEDSEALSMFTDSQDRVRSMALVHEKLYQSADLSNLDFADYAADLTRELFRSYSARGSDIALTVDIQDAFLGVDAAIPCGLIINELVSNALKHAFPDGRTGSVKVSMVRSGAGWVLAVADNGVGLPDDFDIEQTGSLGLQLVTTLCAQLHGELQVRVNGGTEFAITFEPPEQDAPPIS